MQKLGITVPCYNEEEVLENSLDRLFEYLNELKSRKIVTPDSFICVVDDGSSDRTWEIIENYKTKNEYLHGVKFSKNFGNQSAILAGMMKCKKLDVDCVATIDADLQQDERTIEKFIEKYNEGNEIVCGIRRDRKTDSLFKKYTAIAFYKIMNLLGAHIRPNHSDFRLVGRKALNVLAEYKEYNIFLRGIFHEFGLKMDYVYFDVRKRPAGTSKFTTSKLILLALDGVTSFSVIPLRLVAIIGILMWITSFIIGVDVIYEKYVLHTTLKGWATIVFVTSFIGGTQTFCIGVIGEYVARIYREVKGRPRYIAEKEF